MSLPPIYRSPEDYLVTIIQRIQDLGSRITDFNTGSTARTFYDGHAVALSQQSAIAEQLRKDSYLATATGDALTLKALDYQVVRKDAQAATGTLRITRVATGAVGAVSIPAGWGSLTTFPAPGVPSVAYVTIESADFAAAGAGTQTVDVAAVAVTAGVSGNIVQGATAETRVVPVNPVVGFASADAFVLRGPVTGGVDAEDDDALRARVPIEVAGRVKGRREALLAAALRVVGVRSAQVRGPGQTDAAGATLAGGDVVVYYDGPSAALGDVTVEVLAATMIGQVVTVEAAAATEYLADVDVYVNPGVDLVAVQLAARALLQQHVANTPTGGLTRLSGAVQALHTLNEVVAVDMPFNDFRKVTETDGLAHDVQLGVGKRPSLTDANTTVTVIEL